MVWTSEEPVDPQEVLLDPNFEAQDRGVWFSDLTGWQLDGSANTGAEFKDYGGLPGPYGEVVMECVETNQAPAKVARFGQIWTIPLTGRTFTCSFWVRKTAFFDENAGDREIEVSMYNIFPVPGLPFDPSDPLPGGNPMGRVRINTYTEMPAVGIWKQYSFSFPPVYFYPGQWRFPMGFRFRHLSAGPEEYNITVEFDAFHLIETENWTPGQAPPAPGFTPESENDSSFAGDPENSSSYTPD